MRHCRTTIINNVVLLIIACCAHSVAYAEKVIPRSVVTSKAIVVEPAVPYRIKADWNITAAPTIGGSLFDQIFSQTDGEHRSYNIPYPIHALVEQIEQHLGYSINNVPNKLKYALFPVSRCVNRFQAGPDYFKNPRVVFAAESEDEQHRAPDKLLVKDRLYLGYQEHTGDIEVISYNEDSGEFDFLQISNYKEHETALLKPVNRSECVSCHSTNAPIFPNARWQETDFNPAVLKEIARARGLKPDTSGRSSSNDIASIAASVSRANLFGLYQTVWQRGCQSETIEDQRVCRAAMFETILRNRLADYYWTRSASDAVARHLLPTLQRNAKIWSNGISTPVSTVPGGNPLRQGISSYLASSSAIQSPGKHSIIWRPNDLQRIVHGLGSFISKNDIVSLDKALAKISGMDSAGFERRKGTCDVTANRDSKPEKNKGFFTGELSVQCTWPETAITAETNLFAEFSVDGGSINGYPKSLNTVLGGARFLVNLSYRDTRITEKGENNYGLHIDLLEAGGRIRPRLPGGQVLQFIDLRWCCLDLNVLRAGEQKKFVANAELDIHDDTKILEKTILEMAYRPVGNLFDNSAFNARLLMQQLLDSLNSIMPISPGK